MKRIFLVLGIVLATIAPAMASQSMNVLVRVQPTSPVRIDDCKAYINDTDVGNVNYYLDLAADYSNLDPKPQCNGSAHSLRCLQ